MDALQRWKRPWPRSRAHEVTRQDPPLPHPERALSRADANSTTRIHLGQSPFADSTLTGMI